MDHPNLPIISTSQVPYSPQPSAVADRVLGGRWCASLTARETVKLPTIDNQLETNTVTHFVARTLARRDLEHQ